MNTRELTPWAWSVKKSPLRNFESIFDFLVDDFFRTAQPARRAQAFSPRVNVSEDKQAITVRAELPGLSEKDIDISLTTEFLILKGEKKEEHEKCEGKNCFYSELSYGAFERVIPLTGEVDPDQVEAAFKNGVLTITLPRTVEAGKQHRKISIRSE